MKVSIHVLPNCFLAKMMIFGWSVGIPYIPFIDNPIEPHDSNLVTQITDLLDKITRSAAFSQVAMVKSHCFWLCIRSFRNWQQISFRSSVINTTFTIHKPTNNYTNINRNINSTITATAPSVFCCLNICSWVKIPLPCCLSPPWHDHTRRCPNPGGSRWAVAGSVARTGWFTGSLGPGCWETLKSLVGTMNPNRQVFNNLPTINHLENPCWVFKVIDFSPNYLPWKPLRVSCRLSRHFWESQFWPLGLTIYNGKKQKQPLVMKFLGLQ